MCSPSESTDCTPNWESSPDRVGIVHFRLPCTVVATVSGIVMSSLFGKCFLEGRGGVKLFSFGKNLYTLGQEKSILQYRGDN